MCEKYQTSNIDPCGLSEFILVPHWNLSKGGLIRLPDNIDFSQAALIEPIACCLRSLNKVDLKKAATDCNIWSRANWFDAYDFGKVFWGFKDITCRC